MNYKLLEGLRLWLPVDKLLKFSKQKLDGRPNSSIIPQWVDFYKILEDAEEQGYLNLGSSSPIITYENIGNSIIVKKSGNAEITSIKNPGVIIITVPDSVVLHSAIIVTSSSDYNNGELQIRLEGGKQSGVDVNTLDSDMMFPIVELENRNVISTSQNYQSVDKDPADTYNIQYVRPVVSGQTTTLITGLSGDMGIKLLIP